MCGLKTLPRAIALGLALLLALGFWGCAGSNNPLPEGFVPALAVTGDVDNPLRIDRASAGAFEFEQADKDGAKLPSLPLAALLEAALPRAADFEILFVGADGLSAKIDGGDLTGVRIAFSRENAWEVLAERHPVSTRIKTLQRIIVVSREGAADGGVTCFSAAEGVDDVSALTPGQAALLDVLSVRTFEGESDLNGYGVTVYTPHLLLKADALVPGGAPYAVVGRDGAVRWQKDAAGAYVEIAGNRFDFVFSDGTAMTDIAGVMGGAPQITIAETYRDALHMLERGDAVLIIELDGWGWALSQAASNQDSQPFLSSLPQQRALAAWPSISPVGLASMLTGALPDVHGVHDRITRALAAPDLFEAAADLSKTALYVEGEAALVDTSLPPLLSPDTGGEPGTDDEVFSHAQEAIAQRPDLLFVHFHGIDDDATAYGPYAPETFARVAQLDDYVRRLVALWPGRVIITADHGLHDVAEPDRLGTHGSCAAEDMVVPYILCDGGLYAAT